jgi:UDP-N-acetylmuramate--alanine ligase
MVLAAPCIQSPAVLPGVAMTFREKEFFFIGIGGIGTSGIAKVLLSLGKRVSGSDTNETAITRDLERKGAEIHYGHKSRNLPAGTEMVIVSAAIKDDNPELVSARTRNLPVLKYSQALGCLMKDRTGIAISGTHGKTTTAAMISYIMRRAGLDPAYVIGGNVPQLGGSSHEGAGSYFVAEACEYDRSFLNLHPRFGAIMNIEEDHLDYYKGGIEEIIEAFSRFVEIFPDDGVIVVNGYDKNALCAVRDADCEVQTVGIHLPADWRAEGLEEVQGRFHFDIIKGDEVCGRVKLTIPGMHNVLDALTAAALAFRAGLDERIVTTSLSEFAGADRRFQILGTVKGITFVDDYAHHPTEIQVTLKAARSRFPGRRIVCVFQPHQYSRTRFLLKDFARSFGNADLIYIPDIYFVRDSEDERKAINSTDLAGEVVNLGGTAKYLPTFEEIKGELTGALRAGDILMTMGAGNIFELAHELMEELSAESEDMTDSGSEALSR